MSKPLEQIPEDIKKLSFEAALSALEEIVTRLEAGEISLDDSIDTYTRGTWLKRHCDANLKAAQAKIEKITFSEDGAPKGTEPFEKGSGE